MAASAALLQPPVVPAMWLMDLRKLGVSQPIGFFLHTPFPTRGVFSSVPHHRELVQAMLAYDLIGVQTDEDHANLAQYFEP